MRESLSQQQMFRHYFFYDPGTGILYRHKRPEKPVGSLDTRGYLHCCYQGKSLLIHRIIWIYVNEEILEGYEIDHINNIRTDNRLINLRLTTRSENTFNKKMNKNNTSGIKGISFHKQQQKWGAKIVVDGKPIYEKYFHSLHDAEEAIKKAREYYHGEFANHGEEE